MESLGPLSYTFTRECEASQLHFIGIKNFETMSKYCLNYNSEKKKTPVHVEHGPYKDLRLLQCQIFYGLNDTVHPCSSVARLYFMNRDIIEN